MKEKALVLGAKPPFEGPFVSLNEAGAWKFRFDTLPVDADISDVVEIVYEQQDGTSVSLTSGEIDGVIRNPLTAKAILHAAPGVACISIVAEATNE